MLRSESARRRREDAVFLATPPAVLAGADASARPGSGTDHDDTLTLLFLCCHPALSPSSQVALTLRAVGGLTTAEIARAFGVPEATMAQRISRAKQQIREAGARFTAAGAAERDQRLRAVQQVLYLIFNEGYTASAGERLQRTDLAARGNPAGPAAARAAARRRGDRRPAGADAAHRCQAGARASRRTAPSSRWRNRTAPAGTGR